MGKRGRQSGIHFTMYEKKIYEKGRWIKIYVSCILHTCERKKNKHFEK